MESVHPAYREVLAQFVAWAQARPDIRAAHLAGSYARPGVHPPDEWSDLDLVLYTTWPLAYRQDSAWINAIAPLWLAVPDDDGARLKGRWAWLYGWMWFATLEGGLAVDFVIRPAWELIGLDWRRRLGLRRRAMPAHAYPLDRTTILVDKAGRLGRLGWVELFPADPPGQPDAETFRLAVEDFWGLADRATRKLGRGDLYTARRLTDSGMQARLLEMMRWHAGSLHGWGYPTGWRGSYLDDWADPRAAAAMRAAYAHLDAVDIKRALRAKLDLYRWLAIETGQRLGFPYPQAVDDRIAGWINEQLPRIQDETHDVE